MTEAIKVLNAKLGENKLAVRLNEQISRCPNPLVLDFNGVLVSDKLPVILNPETERSLEYLLQHGITPFIITLANDRNLIECLLSDVISDFSSKVVIMTKDTWGPVPTHPPLWFKQVRHLFPDGPDIAIIENDRAAAYNNPGMRGFFVKTFSPLSETLDADIKYDYQSLWTATIAAVQYYNNR